MTDLAFERFLDENSEQRRASCIDFLRIPSISVLQEHAPDCRSAAAWVADELRRIGVEHVEATETAGHPIVYGDWLHADGAPTVLVYGHYDVQPIDPIELWESSPFEPIVKGDRIIGRGAADDKGQIHIHLKAAEALLATRGRLPVNLRFVFEGEEEATSANLEPWLAANRDRVAADLAVISDTGFFDGNLPAITVGLRGISYAQIDVEGSPVDLHSGSYGGAVQNPANALCEIVAGLKGPDGRIRIPGFYDDVVPLSEDDRAALAELPFDEDAYRRSLGLPALFGEAGFTTIEPRGARPTLDVNGIWSGFQGEGGKAIIPAHAHAKVSCRLVADQDPDTIFEALRSHVAQITPPGVRASVQFLGGGHPSLTPIDHPATQAAARALESTFGRPPLHSRGRLDPRLRQLLVDPRIAGRPPRLHATRRQRPCPQRIDGSAELRDCHPDDRPLLGRARDLAWPTPASPRSPGRRRRRQRPCTRSQRGSRHRHKRVHFHFTPTSASWLNQVETWFGVLTSQALRRSSFESVRALVAAIERFTRSWNEGASPFTWVKTTDQILAKAVRKPQATSGAGH